jgi:hypothetical protein
MSAFILWITWADMKKQRETFRPCFIRANKKLLGAVIVSSSASKPQSGANIRGKILVPRLKYANFGAKCR